MTFCQPCSKQKYPIICSALPPCLTTIHHGSDLTDQTGGVGVVGCGRPCVLLPPVNRLSLCETRNNASSLDVCDTKDPLQTASQIYVDSFGHSRRNRSSTAISSHDLSRTDTECTPSLLVTFIKPDRALIELWMSDYTVHPKPGSHASDSKHAEPWGFPLTFSSFLPQSLDVTQCITFSSFC